METIRNSSYNAQAMHCGIHPHTIASTRVPGVGGVEPSVVKYTPHTIASARGVAGRWVVAGRRVPPRESEREVQRRWWPSVVVPRARAGARGGGGRWWLSIMVPHARGSRGGG